MSLLPSLTESVCALGACDRLVGTDRYSDWPASVQQLPKLGGLDDTLIERLVALRPDLVLAVPATRAIPRLESLGIPVLGLQLERHEAVREALVLLAQLLGRPQAADRVWAAIQRDISTAAARVPAKLRGRRVYFEVDGSPYAAGAASFVGVTLTRLGLVNIVPAAMGPFPRLNPEYVVRQQPEIIMAERKALAGMAARPGWSRLTALQRRGVCGFSQADYAVLVRPGPRLGEAALRIADCLAALPETAAP